MATPNPEPAPKRETGRIKWFNFERGYGFIIRDESGEDIFLHITGFMLEDIRSIQKNDRVEYRVIQGVKGPRAVNVVLLTEE